MSDVDAAKDPRAYAQWVIMRLKNSGSVDIKLKNLNVSMGKLHADGNKDEELDPSKFEDYIIHPGEQLQLNACGKADSPSGTAGDFDMVDVSAADKLIRHFFWDSPWPSSATNTWTVSGSNSKWIVESYGPYLEIGALGTITTEFCNKA